MHAAPGSPRSAVRTMHDAVPQPSPLFWLVTVCATAVGETGADLLTGTLGLGLTGTTLVAAVVLVLGLTARLADRRAVPALYWADVVVMSVVGTLVADGVVDGWGVARWMSTLLLALGLGVVLCAWQLSEHTVSVRTIVTRRQEAFHWLAILLAFALGTSAGDWAAEGVGLGRLAAAAVSAGAIAVVAVLRFGFGVGETASFWIAYVLTRALGTSLGDLLTQAPQRGGLGLGTAVVSEALLLLIAGGVIGLTVRRRLSRRRSVLGVVLGA